jgi:hypothetical protein
MNSSVVLPHGGNCGTLMPSMPRGKIPTTVINLLIVGFRRSVIEEIAGAKSLHREGAQQGEGSRGDRDRSKERDRGSERACSRKRDPIL